MCISMYAWSERLTVLKFSTAALEYKHNYTHKDVFVHI